LGSHWLAFPHSAQFVVDTIGDLIEDSSLTSESTVAIIYRTNSQSRFLEEACVSKNLPYVIRGGAGGFYKRAEIKDCLCFLRWLYNGNDESAMIRAFQTPSRGLGDKAIAAFKTYCGAVDSFYRNSSPGTARPSKLDILLSMTGLAGTFLAQGAPEPSDYIPKRALNHFLPFAGQMSMFRKKAYTSPVDSLLFDIIGELDLLSHFDSISKSKTEFEERRENVQELRRATKRYSIQGPSLVEQKEKLDMEDTSKISPLGAFLDDVALVSDIAADEGDSDLPQFVIKLMTIHASKGTEYDAVFLVGNEEGTLPSHLSIQEGEDSIALQEERRLCYVAMTRAKTRLVMTWRKEVSTFSGWSAAGPKTVTKSRSRFLDALVAKGHGKKPNSLSTGPKKTRTVGSEGQLNGSTGSSPRGQSPRGRVEATMLRSKPAEVTRPRPTDGSSALRTSNPQRPRPSTAGNTVSRSSNDSKPQNNSKTSTQQGRRSLSQTTVSQSSPQVTTKTPVKSVVTAKTQTFDSTIFYPVGSDVIHHNFGKGKVLEPPPPDEANKSLVRVAFDNGRTVEFPVEALDLFPVF
jgi:ATP-dependent exoDNAse (exonuclease V) beta subunit